MDKRLNCKDGSGIYAHIAGAPLAAVDRQSALEALKVAEVLVSAVAWAWTRLAEPVAQLFLRPGVKS